jgi:uncharacterized protein
MRNNSQNTAISQVQAWVEQFVVKLQLCPFASKVVTEQSIDYQISDATSIELALTDLESLLKQLIDKPQIETAIIIFEQGFADFEAYLDLLTLSNVYLKQGGYEGAFQIASFHPNYQFQGAEFDDVANYTNRAPYPLLHILRESSLEKGLAFYPEPEQIPERNIEKLRTMGLEQVKNLLINIVNRNQ